MKKLLLTIIFCTFSRLNVFAQMADENKTTISAGYILSSVNYSIYKSSESILTWRDIFLQGAYLNVDFPKAPFGFDKSRIGTGFSASFNGYWTDDDANNDLNVIHVSETKAILIELNYEMLSDKEGLSPKFGFDFNMLFFKNYEGRPFTRPYDMRNYLFLEGLVCTYDIYKFGFYCGVQAFYKFAPYVYLKASGQAGIGFYFTLADWVHRPDYKHPVSFSDFGMSFRVGGDLETGFTVGKLITFYCKGLLFYEASPLGYGIHSLSDDTYPLQLHIMQFTRASFLIGMKVSF